MKFFSQASFASHCRAGVLIRSLKCRYMVTQPDSSDFAVTRAEIKDYRKYESQADCIHATACYQL
jgi:hypothetical protein